MNSNVLDISLSTVMKNAPESPIVRQRRELLTPLSEEGHYLLVMDNSAIETFTTCPTYAMNYLFYGREAHARNAALTFGGAVHVGCEHIERDEGRPHIFKVGPHNDDEIRVWSETDTAQAVLRYFTENPEIGRAHV